MSRLDRTYLDRLYDENSRDRFYIDVSDRDLYDKVKEELMDTKKNRDLFLFAVAKGFSLKLKKEIEKKEDYLRSEYLSPEDFALLYSIAIHDTGKIEIIEDTETIFKIAEEYARGGIHLLASEIEGLAFGSFAKKYEMDITNLYNSILVKDKELLGEWSPINE